MAAHERPALRKLLVLALLIAGALGAGRGLGLFPTWQLAASDILQRRPPLPSSQIVLIVLDAAAVEAIQGRPPEVGRARMQLAALIDRLAAAGARVIALDFLFERATPQDTVLATALRRAGTVVLSAVGTEPHLPATAPAPLDYARVDIPVAPLASAAAAVGHANVWPDRDGRVRAVPLVIQHAGQELPALALVAVARYLRRPAPLDGPWADGHVPLAGRAIPVDPHYRFAIAYSGGAVETGTGAFSIVSAADVLDGRVDPALLRDRLVLVGPWSAQFRDECETPRGTMYCLEVHAYVADALLRAQFLHPAPLAASMATVAGLALVVALLVWRLRPWLAAGIAALLALGYFWLASEAFQRGVVLDMLYPFLALALSYAGLTGYQLVFVQARQRALRRALARYLSPAVAEVVARDPARLDLGGQLRDMTVLFADIRGFTALAERTPPRELVTLLNEYFEIMVAVLFRHEGTLDKFMGDAIMAFWNAPALQPDHAERACRTALAMVAALDQLRASWEARGRPVLDIGIGVSTGPMVFGNTGSTLRADFTVLGDAVNLGARLEGLNKEYGTRIIVAERTRTAAGTAFAFRFLDLVAVKGKEQAVAIYELLGTAEELPPTHRPLLAAYDVGIAAYRARDWPAAVAAFQRALRHAPDDGPSRVYLRRVEAYLRDPPPPTWDGIQVSTQK